MNPHFLDQIQSWRLQLRVSVCLYHYLCITSLCLICRISHYVTQLIIISHIGAVVWLADFLGRKLSLNDFSTTAMQNNVLYLSKLFLKQLIYKSPSNLRTFTQSGYFVNTFINGCHAKKNISIPIILLSRNISRSPFFKFLSYII